MNSSFSPAKVGLITLRNVVTLAIACMIGAAAGALTYMASNSLPQALLAAGTATGGSANLLGKIIGVGPERPASSREDDQHDDQDGINRQQPTTKDPV